MRAIRRICLVLALSAFVASCARPTRLEPTASGIPAPEAIDTRGAAVYRISAEDSAVRILVYRGGTLARLGHNHVVSSKSLSGRVWVHPELARSGFELILPVQSLIVDDDEARKTAGGDFPPGVPQKDIEGTRNNMLGEQVLDAEHHPAITLRSKKIEGSRSTPLITASITIKGVARDVRVPATLAIDGARLRAQGELEILQSDFGMKPFSVALGMLAVQDRLRIEFDLVAERASS